MSSNRRKNDKSKPKPNREKSPLTNAKAAALALKEGWTTSFWSYVRNDDRAIFGKIAHLRDDIRGFYQFMTGREIAIFMDQDHIGWGQQWDSVIKGGINNTVFMMPVVTASFFDSEACRQELLQFNALSARRGLDELILPILFTGIDRVSIESDDEVARIIANAQFVDFSEIWPCERGGEKWCTAVRDIVRELISAEERVENKLEEIAFGSGSGHRGSDPTTPADEDDDDLGDQPGITELMASLPDSMSSSTEALDAARLKFEAFSTAIEHTPLSKNSGAASDPRQFQQLIVRSVGMFRDEATEFEDAASTALDRVNESNALVLDLWQTVGSMNDKSFEDSLTASMVGLEGVAQVAEQMDDMLRQMADLEKMSSVLRKELRPARRGVRFLRDAAELVARWQR